LREAIGSIFIDFIIKKKKRKWARLTREKENKKNKFWKLITSKMKRFKGINPIIRTRKN
jgi:hypothetical protein